MSFNVETVYRIDDLEEYIKKLDALFLCGRCYEMVDIERIIIILEDFKTKLISRRFRRKRPNDTR